MFSSSVSRVTRQLTQLSLKKPSHVVGAVTPNHAISLLERASMMTPVAGSSSVRGFAINRKVIDAKNAKRLKVQAKKKKNTNKPAAKLSEEDAAAAAIAGSEPDDSKDTQNQPFLQHQEWVKFQQSISVDGFQTGQVTSAEILGKKSRRGGKQARNRRERELEKLQERQATDNQKFPAIRYSDEETQELLTLAFATLPEKAGKRGTRNLKRQDRRWTLVRQIRAKYKHQVQQAHERRMEHRAWKRQQTKEVKAAAPAQCVQDQQYQAQVLRRWAQTMFQDPTLVQATDSTSSELGASDTVATAKE